ncbi:DoxX family protein [Candidatus Nomurabacteria bacterium]|nr:MAG: DoxX family protein [Candidatus Nomurabacteria bacterium]
MDTIFLIGRIIFGGYFIYNGVNHVFHYKNLTGYAKMKGVPAASFSVVLSGIIMLLGGLSVLLNIRMILGFWLIVLFLVPTTFIMHAFWKEKDPSAKMNETIAFTKNMALIGASLIMIASVFVSF